MFGIVFDAFFVIVAFLMMCGFIWDDEEEMAFLMGVMTLLFIVLLGFSVTAYRNDTQDAKNLKAAKTKVTKTCYPYAVTHKVEQDNKITFSCANDSKLRVVKVNP